MNAVKEEIRARLLRTGAAAVGFARAGEPEAEVSAQYAGWLAEGCYAGMEWMLRHDSLRRDTANVLEGARTVISLAYAYPRFSGRDPELPMIAAYAMGDDYHDVLRGKLREAVAALQESPGGEWRICIDSAPLPERYWALRSGIGARGSNGSVIVPGAGPSCFLAEILTTLELEPDGPSAGECLKCGACTRACPTGALRHDGTVDARRCLSYLTIEHRGGWTQEQKELLTRPGMPRAIFGCDICHRVCPMHGNAGCLPQFAPRPGLLTLTADEVNAMDQETFSRVFRHSPVKRAKLDGLKRNGSLLQYPE